MQSLRIVVHDFAGHPFQVQLSRELAGRGNRVTHAYARGLPGPKGSLQSPDRGPTDLTIRGVPLSRCFRKYSPLRRFISHRRYARDLWNLICQENAQIVLSANTPIDIQAFLLSHCRNSGIAFVHWVQDVYFRAMEFFLERKLGKLAKVAAQPFRCLERAVALGSDSVVVIDRKMRTMLHNWGLPERDVTVIENWAPLDELKPAPKGNAWSTAHGLADEVTFVYSGTLGLKHRPDLIYQLAQATLGQAKVVVLTDGVGRQYLERMPVLENLLLLEFQPYECLSEVLASADVLVATLAAEAGQFAVPSKVLAYLCAGRAILLASPKENAAALAVNRSGGGIVVDPGAPTEWIRAAKMLAGSSERREQCGLRARQYAERTFNIETIADSFEGVLFHARRKYAAPLELAEVAPSLLL